MYVCVCARASAVFILRFEPRTATGEFLEAGL